MRTEGRGLCPGLYRCPNASPWGIGSAADRSREPHSWKVAIHFAIKQLTSQVTTTATQARSAQVMVDHCFGSSAGGTPGTSLRSRWLFPHL